MRRFWSKGLGRFASGTMVSRISGFFRDVTMAALFGDHPAVAAFFVAFRFSQLLRALFGERALQATFLPHYEALRRQEKGGEFLLQMLFSTTLFLTGVIALAELFLWSWQPEGWQLLASVLPSVLFLCLYAINSACLQSHDTFFYYSVAPALCNLFWIAALFWNRSQDPYLAMRHLSIAVTLGCALQWLWTLPLLWKELPWRIWWRQRQWIPEVFRRVGKMTLFTLIGAGALQINGFLDTLFAHYADPQGPAYLWFAIRLQQLPLALLGIGSVATLTPHLIRAFQGGDRSAFTLHLGIAGERLSVMLLLTFALFACGYLGVYWVYGRGQFSPMATMQTTQALWSYGLGLFPAALTLLLSALFYARNQFLKPMWAAIATVVASVLMNLIAVFVLHLGAIAIAITTSISSWINALVLFWLWQREEPAFRLFSFWLLPGKELRLFLIAAIIACVGAVVFESIALGGPSLQTLQNQVVLPRYTTLWGKSVCLFLQTALFFTLFWGSLYLLKRILAKVRPLTS